MATAAILKWSNPKCTSTHPKIVPVKFYYNRQKEFLEKKKNPIGFYSEPPTSYAPKNIPKRSPSVNIYA